MHLWFPSRFGYPVEPLRSAREGIDRFLISGLCIGIGVGGEIYAPYGLTDVMTGVLRPNPTNPRVELMLAKARDYQARWPWLKIHSA